MKSHVLITDLGQYRNQHDADPSCLHWEEFWIQCHPKKESTCLWLLMIKKIIWTSCFELVNIRLRSSPDAKAYKAPEDQQPAVNWSKGTQEAVVQSPTHTNRQTLFIKEMLLGNYHIVYENHKYETTYYFSAIFVGYVPPYRGTDPHPDKDHLRKIPPAH